MTATAATLGGGVVVKLSLYNPWSPAHQCPRTTSTAIHSIPGPVEQRESNAAVRGRNFTLVKSISMTQDNSLAIATSVSGNSTL